MVFTALDDSIEGEKIDFHGRKFYLRRPIRINQATYFAFKLSIFGKATITEELRSVTLKHRDASRTTLGDELRGDTIEAHCRKPLPNVSIVNATSSHKGTELQARGNVFAQITIPRRESLTGNPQQHLSS